MSTEATLQELAKRHGMSEGAVRAVQEALQRGGGRLAQFSHPELGGYGQWMPGMTQIGDMFNHALRGRVEQLCQELSERLGEREKQAGPGEGSLSASARTTIEPKKPATEMEPMKPMPPMKPMEPMQPMKAPARWWPEELGESPSSAGGQNEARYAFFRDQRRLAVDQGEGKVEVYDTGDHRISGVQQHQGSSGRTVTFTSQHGKVELAKLQKL